MPALPSLVPGGIAHPTAGASSPGSPGQHRAGSCIPGSLLFCSSQGSRCSSCTLCPRCAGAEGSTRHPLHLPHPRAMGYPTQPCPHRGDTATQVLLVGPALCCAPGKHRGLSGVEAVHEHTGVRRSFLPETQVRDRRAALSHHKYTTHRNPGLFLPAGSRCEKESIPPSFPSTLLAVGRAQGQDCLWQRLQGPCSRLLQMSHLQVMGMACAG